MRKGYVDTDFGQVHYYADGEEGPLLCLFHETALSASEFEKTLPLLGKKCRAVAFDTPGYGMSDPPDAPLDMDSLVTWLAQAIQAFDPDGPYALAGAHTGSSIAIVLATNHLKGQVTHVMLTGLALLTADEIEGFRKIIGKPEIDPDGQFLVEQWKKRRQRWGEDADLDGILWGTAEQLKIYRRANWAFEAVFSHDTEGVLRALDCPTYFFVGEHDSLIESDRRAANIVSDAKFKMLPGIWGRLPYFEPELYAQEVLGFLRLED